MICAAIGNLGTQAQKDRWLPALAGGDAIAAFALTEPDAGSDATQVRATAKTVPGGYVLNGRKQWCTNGGYAAVTMGMFRTGGAGAKGVSAFLIDNATPGIVVEKVTEKLGIHTSNTVDLAFDDVSVPATTRCSAPKAKASSTRCPRWPADASASPRRRPASSPRASTNR